jgi:hypothetical protein
MTPPFWQAVSKNAQSESYSINRVPLTCPRLRRDMERMCLVAMSSYSLERLIPNSFVASGRRSHSGLAVACGLCPVCLAGCIFIHPNLLFPRVPILAVRNEANVTPTSSKRHPKFNQFAARLALYRSKQPRYASKWETEDGKVCQGTTLYFFF